MKILGIDTTTKFLTIGVYDDTRMCGYHLEVDRRLSSLLSITIKRILDALNLRINEIDYFASGLGPGSFTGVRVGLATIKGLSWALKKPVIGISTLDILAKNVSDTDKLIVPIIDAKRELIYCGIFKNKNNQLVRIRPYMLLSIEELFKQIKGNAIIFGDALTLYKDKILRHTPGVEILDRAYWYPKPHNILKLALERIKSKKLDNPFQIKPIYLYPKECQIVNSKIKMQKSKLQSKIKDF